MRVVVVSAPVSIVTLGEAKRQLRVEHDDDDELITDLVDAASALLDGPPGKLGRALGDQVLELHLDGFYTAGRATIDLPYPPLLEIVSVTYDDGLGANHTVAPASYGVLAGRAAYPKVGYTWPAATAARVRYRAGHVDRAPAPVRHATLMMVSRLYASRGEDRPANLVEEPAIAALLAPFRVWGAC